MFFVLFIDPFIRRINKNQRIRGLPIPGQGSFNVSAYADDVSIFILDEESINPVLKDFEAYAQLSGAKLNSNKSGLLPIGKRNITSLSNFKKISEIRILGLLFDSEGISPNLFPGLVDEVRKQVTLASTFQFSFEKTSLNVSSFRNFFMP